MKKYENIYNAITKCIYEIILYKINIIKLALIILTYRFKVMDCSTLHSRVEECNKNDIIGVQNMYGKVAVILFIRTLVKLLVYMHI